MSTIDKIHDDVKRRIESGEPGLAQSQIGVSDPNKPQYPGEVRTSYDGAAFSYAFSPYPGIPSYIMNDVIYDEMVLDVALGQGIASEAVFSRLRVAKMVSDNLAYNSNFPSKHKIGKALQAFYLDDGAPGAKHLK